ncbi:hypothetical protein [Nocardioides zeae]|uniref:Uncharacterized protein n=1 Tax=Nocardioides zeae TaxID=1457234 RepID=A0A6P0HHA0_9ACTN|nr:hypothetical protein [Nocardioides zeae]NEN78099.1 hypothetical protein [Nocardioides zeae]
MPPETPDESGPDPVLDPATAAAVRRLLAEARHDEPAPPAVAARLDATLAGLRAERLAAHPSAPATEHGLPPRPGADAPIDLAARRRRRRGGVLLAAAAAVVVVGVGGVLVPRLGGSGDATSSDSGGQSESGPNVGQAPPPDGNAEEQPPSSAPVQPNQTPDDRVVDAAADLATYEGLLLDADGRGLSSSSFDADLAAVLAAVAADPRPATSTGCGAEPADGTVGVLTELDGATVVVEVTPSAGSADVRVLDCEGEPLLEAQYGAD